MTWLRHHRTVVLATTAALALVAAIAVVVVTRGDEDRSGPETAASDESVTAESRSTTTRQRATTSTTSTTSPTSSTTSTSSSTTSPSPPTTAELTVPPTTSPEADPASPPNLRPPGPQGLVRSSSCNASGPPRATSSITDSDGDRWVTIASVSGNCGGQSPVFRTSGGDARLVYRSDADQFLGFLVDVDDPDSSAGYADVECPGPCADTQFLTNGAGSYRLRVSATDAPWELLYQEYR